MRMEGLIFLVLGAIICIIGILYATDWALVGSWIGGFIMIVISIAIMFPQKRGVNIE